MTAPLREQTDAAVLEQHSVVPLHGSPMPSDPAQRESAPLYYALLFYLFFTITGSQ